MISLPTMATKEFPNDKVRPIREALGLSRAEFAERLNVSPDAVRHWENGIRTINGPAVIVLHQLAAEATLQKKFAHST